MILIIVLGEREKKESKSRKKIEIILMIEKTNV